MRSLIVLRRTEEWGTIDMSEYINNLDKKFDKNCKNNKQYWTNLERIGDWDYIIPYLQYRANLAEVARDTWRDTGINIIDYEDLDLHNQDDDLILIPTDDDDWFCPDLHNKLEVVFADPDMSIVTWPSHRWHPNSITIDDFATNSTRYPIISSNGYAIRVSAATERLILRHMHVHEQPKIHKISKPGNSVWVRHSASWTEMANNWSRQTVFEPMTIPEIDNSIKWAKKHVYKLLSLNMEIPIPMI